MKDSIKYDHTPEEYGPLSNIVKQIRAKAELDINYVKNLRKEILQNMYGIVEID